MDRRIAWVLGIIGVTMMCGLFSLVAVVAAAVRGDRDETPDFGSGEKVGVVEITGSISDSKKALKAIHQFAEADSIKAVVIRVDSPGGAVGPSQEIYDAVKKLSAKKKVVASMGSIAASGGFYIASAAEKVFANAGTLTGSIGVVMEVPNVAGVLKWAGVEVNTVTAGKMKDSGSPFRAMTDDEKKYFEAILKDVHEQFIEAVAAGRKMKVDEVRPLADGRVFSGRQAKEAKLVDELGGIDAAIAAAGAMAGIKGEPKVEYPRRERSLWKQMTGEDSAETLTHAVLNALAPAGLQFRLPIGGAALTGN